LVLNSYAKLNLYLQVLGRRADTFHNIRTVFERIDLCDRIILKPRQDKKIRIICRGNFPIPQDNSNLAYRSAKLLQDNLKVGCGADITIIKRIPVSSGLGGGSSNAAAVLSGLNKLWKLRLSRAELVEFAKRIGSDVPFFIYNCPFAQGRGRGDKIMPIRKLGKIRLWHILVVPKVSVSTPLIYKKWDKSALSFKLTRPKYNVKILLQRLKNGDPFLISGALFNGLEDITLKAYPASRYIREKLLDSGLKAVLMSGSGPATFAIISSRKEGAWFCSQIKAQQKTWRVFLTRTF